VLAFKDHDVAFEDGEIFEFDFEAPVLLPVLQTGGRSRYRRALAPDEVLLGGTFRHETNVGTELHDLRRKVGDPAADHRPRYLWLAHSVIAGRDQAVAEGRHP
jgi:hypothetical protein